MDLHYHRNNCRLCQSDTVRKVVPLQPIPVATPNIDLSKNIHSSKILSAATVPLDLYLCESCGHLQLLDIISPQIQYTTFKYVTSISKGLIPHFAEMAKSVIVETKIPKNAFVVEVGSNDGTLLKNFANDGYRVLGIDPASSTAEAATAEGIPTIADFFSEKLAKKVIDKYGQADCVISNNTFANLDNLDDIMCGIKKLLSKDGLFVFETQYGLDVIEKLLIDTVYHEHLSYFLAKPLKNFFNKHDMQLVNISRISSKGGSIRGYVSHQNSIHQKSRSVEALINLEEKSGIWEYDTYRKFSERFNKMRQSVSSTILKLKDSGQKIAGFGASVGTVTLLNQFQLGPSLDIIFDDIPLSKEIRGPSYSIPVQQTESLSKSNVDVVLILAWRYANQIISKNRPFIEAGGKFVVPWPDLAVYDKHGVSLGN